MSLVLDAFNCLVMWFHMLLFTKQLIYSIIVQTLGKIASLITYWPIKVDWWLMNACCGVTIRCFQMLWYWSVWFELHPLDCFLASACNIYSTLYCLIESLMKTLVRSEKLTRTRITRHNTQVLHFKTYTLL